MLRLVEITSAETGWKGHWYRVGERHWVYQEPEWPEVFSQRWLVADDCPVRGISEEDCRVITPPWHPRAIIMTLGFALFGEIVFRRSAANAR